MVNTRQALLIGGAVTVLAVALPLASITLEYVNNPTLYNVDVNASFENKQDTVQYTGECGVGRVCEETRDCAWWDPLCNPDECVEYEVEYRERTYDSREEFDKQCIASEDVRQTLDEERPVVFTDYSASEPVKVEQPSYIEFVQRQVGDLVNMVPLSVETVNQPVQFKYTSEASCSGSELDTFTRQVTIGEGDTQDVSYSILNIRPGKQCNVIGTMSGSDEVGGQESTSFRTPQASTE